MKKITLVLAMMGLSTAVLAGAPGNNMVAPTGTPVIAPDSTGMWSVGLTAIYAESNNAFQYASQNNSTSLSAADYRNESVDDNWDFGGEVDVSYMFPGSSRDVSASYTYLNFDNSDNLSGGNINGTYLTGSDFDNAKGKSDETLHGATLIFGQLLTVGDRLSLHPFGGLQFAHIDSDDTAKYYDAVGDTAASTTYSSSSDFEGVGPRAGMDASVHLGTGFSIVGTMAGSLLVGGLDSKVNYSYLDNAVTSQYKNDSYTAIVPELDAKLGLDYMHAFNPNMSMNVQLGYQVVNYFNAESHDNVDSITTNSVNNTSDFGYNGPYLRLQLNVA